MSLARPRLAASSRSSRARGSPTSTRRATSQTPRPVIEAMDRYYHEYRATIHRGVYPLAAEATEAYEGARANGRRLHRLDRRARRSSPATRPRRSTSSPTSGAARTSAPATSSSITRDGAPLQPRAVADARAEDGRRARLRRRSTTTACSTSTRSTRCSRAGRSCVAVAHVSNVLGTVNPIAEIAAPRARRRRDRRRRRRAGRAAPAGRRRRARRRLLRLDRPQGLRADRHRRAARPPRAARGDAAVPRRRPHDLSASAATSPPAPSRPRSSRPARRRSPRRSGSAPPSTSSGASGWTRCGRTRATSSATRVERLARGRRR